MKKIITVLLTFALLLAFANVTALAATPDIAVPCFDGSAHITSYITEGSVIIFINGYNNVMRIECTATLYFMNSQGGWVEMDTDWGEYDVLGNTLTINETFDAAPGTEYMLIFQGNVHTTTIIEPIYEVYTT